MKITIYSWSTKNDYDLDHGDVVVDIEFHSVGEHRETVHEVRVSLHGFRVVFRRSEGLIRAWDEHLIGGHSTNNHQWLRMASDGKGTFPPTPFSVKGGELSNLPESFIRELFDQQPSVEFHTERMKVGEVGSPGPGDTWPVVGNVLVAALGAGGAGTVLAAALMRFFTRNRGKKVAFRTDGKVQSMHGYSAAEVERVVRATQFVMEQRTDSESGRLQEQLRQLLSGTDEAREPGSGEGGGSAGI
ncbi:hypothetical protein ACIOYT_31740 [Streptomyces halstedii]|uniref:effector-associated constant component EACC1 n=1 Tax=Streptomyces halstedii TaxID=1944 RepID=UPI00381BBB9C